MSRLFEVVQKAMQNQFLSGGLVLMVTGAVMALFRNAPLWLLAALKRQFSVTLEVVESDPIFDWLLLWLDQHPYTKRSRTLSVSSQCDPDEAASADSAQVVFSPAPGNHLMWFHGRLVWLSRTRAEPQASGGAHVAVGRRRIETLTFRMLGRSQRIARELVAEAISSAQAQHGKRISAYCSSYGYWRRLLGFEPRPLESVVLPAGTAESVVEDVQRFLRSREWYVRMGIPYHRGYLLHGVPGSGKTSLIAAVSGHLRLNLYMLSLAGPGMNDERLADLFMSVQNRSIILIEDVDAVVPARGKPRAPAESPDKVGTEAAAPDDQKGVTLTGLLNCLDGMLAKEGIMVFMTTNFRERLDAALVRPGRVDMDVPFGYATVAQAARLASRFGLPVADELRDDLCEGIATMADVQQALMEARNDGLARGVEGFTATAGETAWR